MREPTYTLDEIESAILAEAGIYLSAQMIRNRVITRLKRKHGFAEGQVAYDPISEEYFQIVNVDMFGSDECRHLNMNELGPHVKALRDAVGEAVSAIAGEENKPYYKKLKLTRKAFDAAVGESDA